MNPKEMFNRKTKKEEKTLNILNYTNEDVVKVLSHLHNLAIIGEIRGVCLIAACDHYTHKIAITGEYRRDPNIAIIPAQKLLQQIAQRARKLERFSEITIQEDF